MGSILLIHGSAPFNRDGRVPDDKAGKYATMTFYKDLAVEFEKIGWKVFRYDKPGVSADSIDFSEYKKTDLSNIGKQINKIWNQMPKHKPRFVFAWSEGSLHISLLPVDEMAGVVILGGISTNIRDVIMWQVGDDKSKMSQQLKEVMEMPRDQMLGLDRPVGRLVDELQMKDNWRYYQGHSDLQMLIVHGENDVEVPLSQSAIWREKLPQNRIKIVTAKGRNHTFGNGDLHGANEIAKKVKFWLKENKTQ